jgi:hypothetical protein
MLSYIKRFLCWIGWHSISVGYETVEHYGCSMHEKCSWCGYEGRVDSQGNLFE